MWGGQEVDWMWEIRILGHQWVPVWNTYNAICEWLYLQYLQYLHVYVYIHVHLNHSCTFKSSLYVTNHLLWYAHWGITVPPPVIQLFNWARSHLQHANLRLLRRVAHTVWWVWGYYMYTVHVCVHSLGCHVLADCGQREGQHYLSPWGLGLSTMHMFVHACWYVICMRTSEACSMHYLLIWGITCT